MPKLHSLTTFSPLCATARRALREYQEQLRFAPLDEDASAKPDRHRTAELSNVRKLQSIVTMIETLQKEIDNGC